MIELAQRLFEAEKKRKKQDKAYLNALLHYQEGNYKKAARLFSRIKTPDSTYMTAISHVKLCNKKQALESLYDYLKIVQTWPASDEKEEAILRIEEINGHLEGVGTSNQY